MIKTFFTLYIFNALSMCKNLHSTFKVMLVFCMLQMNMNEVTAQENLYPNQFPLSDVKLLPGRFQQAYALNQQVLLQYNVARLFAGYRKEAGLSPKDSIFSNWEGLDGHVGGHYLSAMAMNAAMGSEACKERMEYILEELETCQKANSKKYPDWGVGYVGAVPAGKDLWPKLKAGDMSAIWKYWVPWYNVHKTYAGLRDAWLYTGNEKAKAMFLAFCDWAIELTAELSDEQMGQMLASEHGGMNEIFADAYQVTKEDKYINAAKRFSHKEILDPLSENIDNLDNKHANTQVPKAVGFQRIAEITGDAKYIKAAGFFWEMVAGKRSLAFGGNSRREFFPGKAACIDYINDVEGPETCNSYNMLKLTEDLFRTHPSAKYADFYERTLYNHILSTQHPGHGGYVYFTPARPRHYRVYSAPNEAMWCCVGSGMENHSKYNAFIYTKSDSELYVNLFVASELLWKEKGIRLKQATVFPQQPETQITITGGQARFSLMIRYPGWVAANAMKIKVNGKAVHFSNAPASYVAINRTWKKGDVVDVSLPMRTQVEKLINVPQYIAFMHGPVLLAARSGNEALDGLVAGDGRWAHIASGRKLPLDKAPVIVADNISRFVSELRPDAKTPLKFQTNNRSVENANELILEPFNQIHDARYQMYFLSVSRNEYTDRIATMQREEQEKQELDKRTVDFVAPGEQQPEADHDMKTKDSRKGTIMDGFWRDARDGGFFSYRLNTQNKNNLALMVRYWGAEEGSRKFDIYIDEQKLISEDITGKWNKQEFVNVVYKIPDSFVKGKSDVTVKFQSLNNSTAGGVFYIRLLQQ